MPPMVFLFDLHDPNNINSILTLLIVTLHHISDTVFCFFCCK